MPTEETTVTQQGETPTTTTTETVTSKPTTGETPPWGNDFTPERAWNTIQNLRKFEDEAETLRREKAERDQANANAERQRMEENQEFQKLAERTQTELDALKPKAEQAERYETELKAIYEAELATLSDDGRKNVEGLPGNPDMLDRLAYIRNNAALLKPQVTRQGVPGTPPANGETTPPVETYLDRTYGRQPTT